MFSFDSTIKYVLLTLLTLFDLKSNKVSKASLFKERVQVQFTLKSFKISIFTIRER